MDLQCKLVDLKWNVEGVNVTKKMQKNLLTFISTKPISKCKILPLLLICFFCLFFTKTGNWVSPWWLMGGWDLHWWIGGFYPDVWVGFALMGGWILILTVGWFLLYFLLCIFFLKSSLSVYLQKSATTVRLTLYGAISYIHLILF